MPDLMQTAGWVLIHFLWQGALLGAVAWSGCLALKNSSANARYVFLCGIFLVCGLSPVLTWIWLDHHSLQKLALVSSPATENRISELENQITFQAVAYPEIRCNAFFGPRINYVKISETLTEWLSIVTQLWLAGVFFLVLRLANDCFRLQKLIKSGWPAADEEFGKRLSLLAGRMGITQVVSLVESSLVEIPTVMGCFKPILIVPVSFLTSLPADQIEAIFAHELAHVRRYDYCVNLVQVIIETVLFYHPAVWWISHSIREERENCCDDIAISITGSKIAYVSALANLEQSRVLPSYAALAANGGSLLKRVQRVFGPSEQDPFSLIKLIQESYRGAILGLLLMIVFSALFFANIRGSITRHVDAGHLAKELVAAAEEGKLSEIDNLLRQGADPDLNVRSSGNNALFAATSHNQISAIKLLLQNGADIDARNTSGFRAIDWALATGNLSMAKLLREGGAIISPSGWAGATGDLVALKALSTSGRLKKGTTDEAMKDAVSMGQLDAVKFLEKIEGNPVRGKFLVDAASSGNTPMLAYILSHGSIIKSDLENAMDQAVIFYDQPESAKFLLSQGANPNRFTRWGRFILAHAKSARMVKVLLEAGANPNVADMLGTPLSSAPDADSVRLLVKYGADLNRVGGRDGSLVANAVLRNPNDRPEVIKELVNLGAKLDLQSTGVAALAIAAEQNHVKTMQYLLDSGVNPNGFANEPNLRTSPLLFATMASSTDAVELLLKRGCKAQGNSNDGSTPLSTTLLSGDWDLTNLLRKGGAQDVGDLSVAAAFGDLSEVSDLIEHGANVNETDKHGNTPLFYAVQRGHSDVIRLLLQHGAIVHNSISDKT